MAKLRRDPNAAVMAAAKRILATHAEGVKATSIQLATSEYPAQRIINCFFARIGEDRFLSGKHDVWEAIGCIQNEWEYEPPPRHLIDRWAAY